MTNNLSDETALALCHCDSGALWPTECERCNPPIIIMTEVKAKAELGDTDDTK